MLYSQCILRWVWPLACIFIVFYSDPFPPMVLLKLPVTLNQLCSDHLSTEFRFPVAMLSVLQSFELSTHNNSIVEPCDCELYIVIFGRAEPRQCQHFLCEATDEINMMLHAWTFPRAMLAHDVELSTLVSMGVFGAVNVRPTHQDDIIDDVASDASNRRQWSSGVSFDRMEQREVGMVNIRLNILKLDFC